jgi:hypothetical protein
MTVLPVSTLASLAYEQTPWAEPGTSLTPDLRTLPVSLLPVARQLDELTTLPGGWNSYGAKVISGVACEAALALLVDFQWDGPLPAVSPTPGGGVQLEWGTDDAGVELEFGSDGALSILIQADGATWEYHPLEVNGHIVSEAIAWAKKLA